MDKTESDQNRIITEIEFLSRQPLYIIYYVLTKTQFYFNYLKYIL